MVLEVIPLERWAAELAIVQRAAVAIDASLVVEGFAMCRLVGGEAHRRRWRGRRAGSRGGAGTQCMNLVGFEGLGADRADFACGERGEAGGQGLVVVPGVADIV